MLFDVISFVKDNFLKLSLFSGLGTVLVTAAFKGIARKRSAEDKIAQKIRTGSHSTNTQIGSIKIRNDGRKRDIDT